MKKTIFIILLTIVGNLTYGQESKKYLEVKKNYNYREGYILNKDSVRVKGLIFNNRMKELRKYSVVTFVDLNGTKKKYHPNQLKGFGYSIFEFVSDNKLFYEVIQKGKKVSLYKILSANSVSYGMSTATIENFYVKRTNETSFKLVKKSKFQEEYSNYFKDCENVAAEILNKELDYKDIDTIVRRYNACR